MTTTAMMMNNFFRVSSRDKGSRWNGRMKEINQFWGLRNLIHEEGENAKRNMSQRSAFFVVVQRTESKFLVIRSDLITNRYDFFLTDMSPKAMRARENCGFIRCGAFVIKRR